MMNKNLLERELESKNVPKDMYSLNGGLPNEAFCLSYSKGIWEVYYSERGKKTGCQIFTSEKDACNYFLSVILENM